MNSIKAMNLACFIVIFAALTCASGCIRVKLDPVDVKLDVKLQVESQLNEAMPPDMRDRFEKRLPEITALKKSGKIGETFDGYVEAVTPAYAADPKTAELIKAENTDRLDYYQAIARAAQSDVGYVGELSAMKRFEAAQKGEYLRYRDGTWKQKQ